MTTNLVRAGATGRGMRCCCGCIRGLSVSGSARGWRRHFTTCAGSTGTLGGDCSGSRCGSFARRWWESLGRTQLRMAQLGKTMLRVALGALAVWMVPLVASQFFEDWHWGVGGFVRVYVLFFLTGMVMALVARRMGVWSYKAGVGLALVAGFALGWSTMVQVADSGHPERLWYHSVLVVGAIGACLARLKAPGLAWTLFAMAATLALIAVTLPSGAPPDMARRMAIGHGVYVALFTASGLMFRHASLAVK